MFPDFYQLESILLLWYLADITIDKSTRHVVPDSWVGDNNAVLSVLVVAWLAWYPVPVRDARVDGNHPPEATLVGKIVGTDPERVWVREKNIAI